MITYMSQVFLKSSFHHSNMYFRDLKWKGAENLPSRE